MHMKCLILLLSFNFIDIVNEHICFRYLLHKSVPSLTLLGLQFESVLATFTVVCQGQLSIVGQMT